MGKRFTSGFLTEKSDTFDVEIWDSAFSGTATAFVLGEGGFRLNYSGENSERHNPVLGSSAEFDFIIQNATHEGLITDIAGSAEGRFTVKITRGSTPLLFWCGYILPDIAVIEDTSPSYAFKITATDGIGRLKDIDYNDDGDPYTGWDSMLAHILKCLNKDGLAATFFTGSDVFLRTTCNWYETLHSTPTNAKDPLALTRFQHEVLWERDNEGAYTYKSAFEVLKTICDGWQMRILFSNGCYRLEQINERNNGSVIERRYSTAGTQLTTASGISYGVTIDQINKAKLAGSSITWFTPLRRAEVTYVHRTAKNYLENYWGYWTSSFGSNPQVVHDVGAGTDEAMKISGILKLKLSYAGTTPYRVVFQFQVKLEDLADTYYLKRLTTATGGWYTIQYENPTWQNGSAFCEITTDFITSGGFNGEIPFTIWSPALPLGVETLTLDVYHLYTHDINENTLPGVTVESYEITSPFLGFHKIDDSPDEESERIYFRNNPNAGNSELLETSLPFGDGIKPWTIGRLQVNNGTTWLDSAETWGIGAGGPLVKFGELLAREQMKGRETPLEKLRTRFFGLQIEAHSKIRTGVNLVIGHEYWLLIGGTYTAKYEEWEGEWFSIDNFGGGTGTGGTIPIGIGKGKKISLPGSLTNHGMLGFGGGPSIKTDPAGVASLSLLTSTKSGATLAAGAITSIPTTDTLGQDSFQAGDLIYLVNPLTGGFDKLTVSANVVDGDTAIAVTGTLTADYPPNASIVKDPNQAVKQSPVYAPGYGALNVYKSTTSATMTMTLPASRVLTFIIISTTSAAVTDAKIGTSAGASDVMKSVALAANVPLIVDVRHWSSASQTLYVSGLAGTTKVWLRGI